jgi:hypothetical protein
MVAHFESVRCGRASVSVLGPLSLSAVYRKLLTNNAVEAFASFFAAMVVNEGLLVADCSTKGFDELVSFVRQACLRRA